jgi:hypothetical protein
VQFSQSDSLPLHEVHISLARSLLYAVLSPWLAHFAWTFTCAGSFRDYGKIFSQSMARSQILESSQSMTRSDITQFCLRETRSLAQQFPYDGSFLFFAISALTTRSGLMQFSKQDSKNFRCKPSIAQLFSPRVVFGQKSRTGREKQ